MRETVSAKRLWPRRDGRGERVKREGGAKREDGAEEGRKEGRTRRSLCGGPSGRSLVGRPFELSRGAVEEIR